MNRFLSEKQLLLVFCVLFTVSATFLFWQNEHELDPNQGKSWWTLSFADPHDPESLAFTITNHSGQSMFSYEATYTVTFDKIVTESNTVIITPGESKTITPDLKRNPDVRTSIIVTTGDERLEIYR